MSPLRNPCIAAAALAVVAVASGCSDPYEKADEACNANAQCPLQYFCNRTANVCEREVDNRFVGTLSCEFTQSASDQVSFQGASDISGWLLLQEGALPLRVNVNMGAFCNYTNDGTGDFLSLGYDSTGTKYYMELRLPYPHAGAYELMSIDALNALMDQYDAGALAIIAVPPGSTNGTIIAESKAGFAVVDVDPVPGTIPSVYVDVEMVPQL